MDSEQLSLEDIRGRGGIITVGDSGDVLLDGVDGAVSCIVDRALDALIARTWIVYRLGQSHTI
jgi:hypothetical protein